MNNRNNHIKREIIWLLALLMLAIIVTRFFFQLWLSNSALDVFLDANYVMLQQWVVIIAVFLFLTFVSFSIKALHRNFHSKSQNLIALLSGMILVIALTIIPNELLKHSLTFSGGWTSYPPLSALGDTNFATAPTHNRTIRLLTYLFMTLQLGVTISLLFLAYSWGKTKHYR
jgi:hypothetical protein